MPPKCVLGDAIATSDRLELLAAYQSFVHSVAAAMIADRAGADHSICLQRGAPRSIKTSSKVARCDRLIGLSSRSDNAYGCKGTAPRSVKTDPRQQSKRRIKIAVCWLHDACDHASFESGYSSG